MVVLAAVNALAYRDQGFGTFALYVAMLSAAQGIPAGVAGLYWWPTSPQLNNAGAVLLSALSAASALGFVHTITRTTHISRQLGWLMQRLMAALRLCGLVNALVHESTAFAVYNALISLSIAVLILALITAMFRGNGQLGWAGIYAGSF